RRVLYSIGVGVGFLILGYWVHGRIYQESAPKTAKVAESPNGTTRSSESGIQKPVAPPAGALPTDIYSNAKDDEMVDKAKHYASLFAAVRNRWEAEDQQIELSYNDPL